MTSRRASRAGWRGRLPMLLLPFCLFIVFVAIAFVRITGTPEQTADQIPSALSGRQMPDTVLPLLTAGPPVARGFDTKSFRGRVTLVNFWGSWCPPCREEHPFLMTLAGNRLFDLAGINYKDTAENALRFLGLLGNPFRINGFDPGGRAAIDWGVYGPPETFVIDREGTVIYRHIGPLTPAAFREKVMPLIIRANGN